MLVVAVLTRATARRIVASLAGGLTFAVVALGIIALGENAGWGHMAIAWAPYFLTVLLIDFTIPCAAIYLITWRIARRFGSRGLAGVVAVLSILGPVRAYWLMGRFPDWGAYASGFAPVLAVAATYAMMIPLGHGVMRWIAGPDNLPASIALTAWVHLLVENERADYPSSERQTSARVA